MKNNAVEQYQSFIGEIDTKDLTIESDIVVADEVDEAILDKVHSCKGDLIIVGARGRSATASLLLGSLTEKLIRKSHIPILAVKKKGAGMGFVDALLNM
ncbi:MAG: hypothetical protein A2161_00450 [Candidatus Schekmanbacteria bacterium RBG_13_48_7]|uniref:UspA domain-containing protein n=1 Tax=Candidatus Schekmanbacteria bacterium RBG_13_48_7 TaxID=1817878 RepID=A0A1F7RKH5_9BACT|nr:MAG: hypothetical protein A2161_00450 [Candidatus Schekmanbacteria bacterium RBG_13_48_7]